MKSKILLLFLSVLLIFTLSGCLLQQAGPDPQVPQYYNAKASAPSPSTGRLIKVEYEELLDTRGTYRHQEYNYDEQGRLVSIYAPDDYLPCVSEIPYTWLLFDHGDVIEERYEYDDEGHLIRVSGYLPEELSDNPQSYEIPLTYDDSGNVIQESLTDSVGECSVSVEYDGSLVRRVISSDGRTAEMYYENDELARIVLPGGELTYSREPGEFQVPTESSVTYDGYSVNISCTGPRAYTEKADYTEAGKLMLRTRDYADDPQNLYYWHYYYS